MYDFLRNCFLVKIFIQKFIGDGSKLNSYNFEITVFFLIFFQANIIRDDDNQYIRALSTAIFEFFIKPYKQSYKLDNQSFEHYAPLLSRYIDNKEECELNCLYSLQKVIHLFEHPQGKYYKIIYRN